MSEDLSWQLQYWGDKVSRITGGAFGSLAGVALGTAIGGPAGALVGGALGAALSGSLTDIGREMSKRLLSPREEARVGRVFVLAAEEIIQRKITGENVRDDGFFETDQTGRGDAQEIWESVLLKSQREPEEKKLPYMAHLLAGISFDSKINVHMAHQLIKMAEQLTYRQLCILRLSALQGHFTLRKEAYRQQTQFDRELLQYYTNITIYTRKDILTSLVLLP